jgi:hypothetical protein
MSPSRIPAPQVFVTPGDTKWALAAKVPPAVLEAARRRLAELSELPLDGSQVMVGDQGMAVLLAFDGPPSDGEYLAVRLSRKHRTPFYVLDFDDNLEYEDYAVAIMRFDGNKLTRMKGNPVELLESYGIMVPGFGPLPESPVTSIGVVEDVTLDEARKAMPEAQEFFIANARGVLVKAHSGAVTMQLARAFYRRSYVVFYDREDKTFLCSVCHPDQMGDECFPIGMDPGSSPVVDSILGETTMDGILRVLDIPRDALIADGGAAQDTIGRKISQT